MTGRWLGLGILLDHDSEKLSKSRSYLLKSHPLTLGSNPQNDSGANSNNRRVREQYNCIEPERRSKLPRKVRNTPSVADHLDLGIRRLTVRIF